MSKILDLDQLVPVTRAVTLKGERHEMKQLTVEDFLKNVKLFTQLSESQNVDEQFTLMVEVISKAFPSMKVEDVKSLTLPQLNALAKFVEEADKDEQVKEAAAQGGEKNG